MYILLGHHGGHGCELVRARVSFRSLRCSPNVPGSICRMLDPHTHPHTASQRSTFRKHVPALLSLHDVTERMPHDPPQEGRQNAPIHGDYKCPSMASRTMPARRAHKTSTPSAAYQAASIHSAGTGTVSCPPGMCPMIPISLNRPPAMKVPA